MKINACGQHGLAVTLNSFTSAELSTKIFLQHLLHAFGGVDIAGVDKAVKDFSRSFDDFLLFLRESRYLT